MNLKVPLKGEEKIQNDGGNFGNNLLQPKPLDLNPEFKKAYELMEKTDKNVFITGRVRTYIFKTYD